MIKNIIHKKFLKFKNHKTQQVQKLELIEDKSLKALYQLTVNIKAAKQSIQS